MKLNLGGGNKKLEGYVNVDLFAENPEYRVDLMKLPWPFADKSVDAVAMFHFLEHVEDLEQTILEVHRILKTGGEFWVVVPHARHPAAYDISHRHRLNCSTFQTMSGKSYYRFGGKQIFQTTFFKMPMVNFHWIQWTPLDLISTNFPVFFEKFIPIAPAHIEWKGVAV
jgi:SAM-dependent methyltransferase